MLDLPTALRWIGNAPTNPPDDDSLKKIYGEEWERWPRMPLIRSVAIQLLCWADEVGCYSDSICRIAERSGVHELERLGYVMRALVDLGWFDHDPGEGVPWKRCETWSWTFCDAI